MVFERRKANPSSATNTIKLQAVHLEQLRKRGRWIVPLPAKALSKGWSQEAGLHGIPERELKSPSVDAHWDDQAGNAQFGDERCDYSVHASGKIVTSREDGSARRAQDGRSMEHCFGYPVAQAFGEDAERDVAHLTSRLPWDGR